MSCQSVQGLIPSHFDRKLAEAEQKSLREHLAACRKCAARMESEQQMRAALRSLGKVPVPARLTMQLRVMASREQIRQLSRRSLTARIRYWADTTYLLLDNLMRPLALPFAGGLVSALVLFSMLVPTLAFRHNFRNDVPTAIYTDPSLEEMKPVDFAGDETVVELTIDERGRVTDYSVSHGQMTPEVQNDLILFSRFAPATLFGRPTWGKVMVYFRRSHIIVKG